MSGFRGARRRQHGQSHDPHRHRERLLRRDGQFVTAGHVVSDRPAWITLRNAEVSLSAQLVGFQRFEDGDVALLSASAPGLAPLEWAGTLTIGTDIAIAGYPEALGTSASGTRGTVSRLFAAGGISYVQTDAASSPGNSGGPLVDACGRVAGVISSSYVGERGSEGLHFAVAEPTLGRELTALGLRGYDIGEDGSTGEEVTVDSGPRAVQYSGQVLFLRSSEAEGYGPAPEGTTISAIVGDTVCATTTIGAPCYGETRYRLSVEEGCGGAEEGVEVKLRAELKTLDPGWTLWQHAKTLYWARSETVDILMQARPPTPTPTPHATFTGKVSDCARYAIGADEHCEQRIWPELITVSALVGGVTCDVKQYRLTRGYNSYPWNSREAQYELSVAKGCGGAETGSTVTFTVNDDFVTTAAWMPGVRQMDLLPGSAGNSPSQQPT